MKKTFLLLALCFIGGVTYAQSSNTYAKAYQQSIAPIHVDTSTQGLLNNEKQAEKNVLKDMNSDNAVGQTSFQSEVLSSNMPIADRKSIYADLMPTAKPGERNTKYTMMVKRVTFVKRVPEIAKAGTEPNADKEK